MAGLVEEEAVDVTCGAEPQAPLRSDVDAPPPSQVAVGVVT